MKFIILLFLFFNSVNIHAQTSVFKHYNFKDGLFDGRIRAITEDQNGFIWIGTISGLYSFDGELFKKIPSDSISSVIEVLFLYVDHNNNIWVSTKNNGLLLYKDERLRAIKSSEVTDTFFQVITDTQEKFWIGTSHGIMHISNEYEFEKPLLKSLLSLSNKPIRHIEFISKNEVALSSLNEFFIVNLTDDHIKSFKVSDNNTEYIHDIYRDKNNKLWIATSKQLLVFDLNIDDFISFPVLNNASRVLSFAAHKNHIWVATIDGGLFRINSETFEINQYNHNREFNHSLLEQNIMTVFISQNDYLWVGGFSKGLDFLHLPSLNFHYETNVADSLYCAQSAMVRSIDVDSHTNIWLGQESGLIKYDSTNNICELIDIKRADGKPYEVYVYSTLIDGDNVWISTSKGLLQYNQTNKVTKETSVNLHQLTSFFSYKIADNVLIVGTASGLYKYEILTNTYSQIKAQNEKFNNKAFVKFAVNSKKELYLPTTEGLLVLNQNLELKELHTNGNRFSQKEIIGIQVNKNDELLVSVYGNGLYYLNSQHHIIKHYIDQGIFSSALLIHQIQFNKNNHDVWMSSNRGIIYLDLATHDSYLFTGHSDINHFAQTRSSDQFNGKFYFSGASGYVSFNPQDLTFVDKDSEIIIKNLFVMNDTTTSKQAISPDLLSDNLNNKKQHLEFGHKDKLISIEFITPVFSNAKNIKYGYKLAPDFNDWIELPPGENHLTFTHLKPGKYNLSLRATNYDNTWSKKTTNLGIKINPAPWLTWWAYLIYFIITILSVYLYIRNKLNKEKKLNQYLNAQVEKQTEHIQKQKEKLDVLISRKDEIFANVTHEFRTPITLIKGPISTLEKDEKNKKKRDLLEMMKRNSNRLLKLVNQMLALSEIVEDTDQKKNPTKIAAKLKLIAEPYIFEAKKNDIDLNVTDINDVVISVTCDALELIIGNFLSNAIKYTQKNGLITLGCSDKDNAIEIFVEDSGYGFDQKDKSTIFKRFSRLSDHQEIEGTGIGLALVKEVAELNNGIINVDSEKGKGSRFSITFPLYKSLDGFNNLDELEDNQKVDLQNIVAITNNEKDTVLIIDDNKDMRNYIQTTLEDNFNCLVAANGKDGIALALKSVPDIIICDVMMPGIDGFHVCRLLREEVITSHIPLILLTALAEKSSRIKGWRENIDMYLNKPFDADELNLQLRNVLNIRNIINKKNHTAVYSDINEQPFSNLSELDQDFIDKLKTTIKDQYREPSFNLKKLAQTMFVSDRQLQRKTKALIDVSPVDYIREYRLKKAVKLLKDGYQISIASDNSGFSSLSTFSQAFKKHYGMSPKEYQKLNSNK